MSLDISNIQIAENNDFVTDLDCGEGENPDLGRDICAATNKDENGFGEDTEKPSSYTLTLGDELTSEINSSQGDKLEVGAVMPGDDGDGSYYILVSDDGDPSKLDKVYFSGEVGTGESFTANGIDGKFGSETYVHIFSSDGGTLLQTINFHTSCSAPLVIGDQYGSISLEGATLEGKDTGTIYEVGGTAAPGDDGVIYEIKDGPGSDLFEVNANGEVSFKEAPDFENPQGIPDADGNPTNNYEVVVLATLEDGSVIEKPLEICVEDDCINVLENTNPVIADLDCGEGENPDLGRDICAATNKDENGFGEDTEKPSSYTLTLGDELTSEINSSQGDKLEVGAVMPGDDGDGSYYILVSDDGDPSKLDKVYFSGEVGTGESFTANGIDGKFGSETYVHIFSSDGGTLLQTINFHTSCSAPLVIGDQYGSISLEGATLEGKDTGTIYEVGGTAAPGDDGVIYEIKDGPGSDLFEVNANGEVSFKEAPDFENPQGIPDADGNPTNNYEVVVLATLEDGSVIEKPLEICVEDDCINVLENTNPVIADLDCGEGENPDLGRDICAATNKDENGFGEDTEKPSSYTLTLGDELTSEINSSQGDKLEVGAVMPGDDGDGSYYILVSDDGDPSKLDKVYFSGEVGTGESFTANGIDGKFGSETYVHIFSSDGGTLLQTINFHTSCSAPLVIGDQYGSISLEGATLEGKDTGTIYEVGGTAAPGDDGVIYEIKDGPGSDLFEVNANGEVSFKEAPDFENPQGIPDADGNPTNNYEVVVLATLEDGSVIEKPLEICVEDQNCIQILENTDPGVIADLDCENQGPVNPDQGLELCTERDALRDSGVDASKLTQLTLKLGETLTTEASTDQGGKLEVGAVQAGDDGDGIYFIRVSDNDNPNDTNDNYFTGVLNAGESFTFSSVPVRSEFGAETLVHIFDDDGTFLQTINFHTSCSAPIAIGDQYGSITLEGGAFTDKDTGDKIEYGGSAPRDIVYEITGGDGFDHVAGTSPFFNVDPETGEVTLAFTPDFENPLDDNGDNSYFVEITGYFVNADGSLEICEVKPVEICIEDEVEVGSLSGRYFCDTNDNDIDDGQDTDPGVAGVRVGLISAGVEIASVFTGAGGEYSFEGLDQGTYSVRFTDPDNVLEGKALVTPNVGDDTTDSDAIGTTTSATIDGIVVNPGEDTPNNDAGAEYLPGSLSGRYFCDTNDNDIDDGQDTDPGVAGVRVGLISAGVEIASVFTGAGGEYSFEGLDQGTYSVRFTDPDNVLEGKALVTPNVGDDTTDSDAIGTTTSATIDGIVVNPGEDTPNNDAGAEYLPGSLSGRYFCDTNDNDIDDGQDTDPGVAGVRVGLISAGVEIASVFTGAGGEYSFEGLDQGTYSVRFTDPDNVLEGKALVTPNVGDDTTDSDAIGTTTSATIDGIVVNPGEDTPNNDAGAEYLPGSLSGRYFCDTNDNDIDDGQDTDPGVAGVRVGLISAGVEIASVFTGAGGEYSFEGLDQGTYSVRFTDPDNVLEGKALVTPNVGDDTTDSDAIGTTTSATIDGIVVNPGEDTPNNDAGAEYLPGSLSGRYFCDEDGDGVLDPGEAGIDGITVTISGAGADGTFGTADDTQVVTTTGANGSFSADGLDAGTYTVTAGNTMTAEFIVDAGEIKELFVAADCFLIPDEGLFLGDIAETADNRARFGFPEDGFGIGLLKYTADTGKLTGDISLQYLMLEDGTITAFTPNNSPLIRFDLELDRNGDIAGGDSEDLFIFEDDNGNGEVDAGEEVLLTAQAVASSGVNVDLENIDFVFEVTGGSLQDDFDPLLAMRTETSLNQVSLDEDSTPFLKGFVGDLGFDCFCFEDYAFA